MTHSQQLIELYAELAAMTNEICKTCTPPFHCCIPIGCSRAKLWAQRIWRVELVEGKGDMPFLTPTGCTVAPHMRPICSWHLCADKQPPPSGYKELMEKIARVEAAQWGLAI